MTKSKVISDLIVEETAVKVENSEFSKAYRNMEDNTLLGCSCSQIMPDSEPSEGLWPTGSLP